MPSKRTCHGLAFTAGVVASSLATYAMADGPYGRATEVYVPPPPPTFSWRGFYFGGNVGGAWATGTLTDRLTTTSFDTDHSGFIGGGQIGYNVQVDNLVFGVEGDFNWTSLDDTGNRVAVPGLGTLQASAETQWITTLAARVGLALERTFVYVKIGGGWVRNEASITNLTTGTSVTASNTNGGWLVGGGLEYALTPNWTAKFEYDLLALSDQTGPGTFNFERDVQTVKFGINYKFN